MKALQYGWLAVILCLFPSSGRAQQFGDFSYSSDGTNITITKYTGARGNVTIPSVIDDLPVVLIGYEAFYYCPGLTNVTIPNSVTSIGNSAFVSCSGLTNIIVGTNVASIGIWAFSHCYSLTAIAVGSLNAHYSSVDGVLFNKDQTIIIQYPDGKTGSYTIPNSATSIGTWAFSHCSSLTSVIIPNSVSNIGDGAFYNCSGLTGATIGNSVTVIGNDAFYYCSSLTNVIIGNSVTSIGD
jgi:hypothetical protein